MLTSRLTVKNSGLVFFVVVFSLCSGLVRAQENANQSLTVQPGDTFDVTLPVNSSFHSWELVDYDVRKLSLVSREPPSNVGDYRFVFETLGSGDVELEFRRNLNTAISTEELEEHFVAVNIQEETEEEEESPQPGPVEQSSPEESPEPDESQPEAEPAQEEPGTSPEESPSDTIHQPENEDAPENDESYWNRANELIETEYYEEARELIQEQSGQAAGQARQRWRNLEAESYFEQGNYGEAIATWEDMIEEFQQGPQAQWLLSVAEAHQENGAPDQAELALLEIRHHHGDAPEWPRAMTQLAQIAQDKDNSDRARRILEEARSRLSNRQHPDILMKLARIYDQYPSTRNYYKAVKLYQQAARGFDSSDSRSQEARDRANYLRENFLNFGTQ